MSKGLEALERSFNTWDYLKDYETIEKELKALEIIKNKEVNMSLVHHTTNAQHYNEIVAKHELYLQAGEFDKLRFRLLTQEEYDLLKEVML